MAQTTRTPADPHTRQQRLYRRLRAQLQDDHLPQALATTSKLLALDPSDSLARRTHQQLLVALERYRDALEVDTNDDTAQAYCLYKLGRPQDAQHKLRETDDGEEDRAREVLQAQLHYRLGDYEAARDAFDDLAATADQDSPETADLQANLDACTSQLSFLSSVPSTLASLSVPSIEELESRPLAFVLPSSSAPRRPVASTSAAAAKPPPPAGGDEGPKKKRSSRRPLPASATTGAPPPPEDRWIPKRQRPSMRDALLQAKEKARGRKKDKVAMMQGAAEPEPAAQKSQPGTPAKGKQGGGKKKKGKK
ncbi:hypothetical protein JCM8097_004264 [Rhodosporidiobolus ruineniae]